MARRTLALVGLLALVLGAAPEYGPETGAPGRFSGSSGSANPVLDTTVSLSPALGQVPVTTLVSILVTNNGNFGRGRYTLDCNNGQSIIQSEPSAGFEVDATHTTYTFGNGCQYQTAATYHPVVSIATNDGTVLDTATTSFVASSGVVPTISFVSFYEGNLVATNCTQPCSSIKVSGYGTSNSNITWKIDVAAPRCVGADLNDATAACYETLGTTTGAGFQTLILTDVADLSAVDLGQQSFRVAVRDVEGDSAFTNISITVNQQDLWLTGGGPSFAPSGGCTKGTDCSAVTLTIPYRDTCPGSTTNLWADDDTTPKVGGFTVANQASPGSVTLGPFNLDGAAANPIMDFSIQVECGSAPAVYQALTYSVADSPAAPTFGITPGSPQLLNDSVLTPATLMDACIDFTGTETGQVTAIQATLTYPDASTAVLATGSSEVDCVDGETNPIPCPEQWCLTNGGFVPLQLPDAGAYTFAWTATRGAVPKVRTATGGGFTLQTSPINGDLTSSCGDPSASLLFSAPDGTDPAPQSCTFTSLNATPVTFTLTQRQPYVGWVTQLTASNGTCTGANSCTCTTPCTITFRVQDVTGSANQPPTGVSVPDYSITLPTNSQVLSCGTVTDPNGDAITYSWAKTGASCGTFSATNVNSPTMTGLTEGTCGVACAASDPAGSGGVVTDSGVITVAPPTGGGGAGTDWTADSHCRGHWSFEAGLSDDCLEGAAANDALIATAGPVYVTTTPPTGVGGAFRWVNCTGTTLLQTASGASDRFQDNEFTVFAILRTTNSIVSKSIIGDWLTANGTNGGWRIATLSTGTWRVYSSIAYTGSLKPTASTIHTISYSFDRNAAGHGQKLYIDGLLDPNYAQYADGGSSNIINGTGEFSVCGYDGVGSFDGYVSQVLYLGGSGAWLDATQHQDLCRFGPKGNWSDRSAQCD